MHDVPNGILTTVVLLFSAYAVLKFAFFFALPCRIRRKALDKSYAGKAYSTGVSDAVLLAVALALSVAVLTTGAPISFLGGLFVGAVLIQLFFHAFHTPLASERDAPEPRSPLKQMSYAIQDRPARAWKEMTAYGAIVVAGVVLHFFR